MRLNPEALFFFALTIAYTVVAPDFYPVRRSDGTPWPFCNDKQLRIASFLSGALASAIIAFAPG
jgi:hypothetical protein